METWEVTLKRAQESLAVWKHHAPMLKVGREGPAALEALIVQFEPRAQACVTAQDTADGAVRNAQDALATLRLLGVKVPQIIEGHLYENEALLAEMRSVYHDSPRTEATILTRIRELYPFWLLADEAMAAMTPPQPPITRNVRGTPHTAAMAKALLDGYNDLIKEVGQKGKKLSASKADLRDLDAATDIMNKRWFKVMNNSFDPGSAEHGALDGISTEPFTLAPVALEIKSVKQGGEARRQVIVRYAQTGGDRATRMRVRWLIVGLDEDFVNEAPLDRKGNTLGPFEVGTELRIIAEVANSVSTRTSAPRSIVIAESIG